MLLRFCQLRQPVCRLLPLVVATALHERQQSRYSVVHLTLFHRIDALVPQFTRAFVLLLVTGILKVLNQFQDVFFLELDMFADAFPASVNTLRDLVVPLGHTLPGLDVLLAHLLPGLDVVLGRILPGLDVLLAHQLPGLDVLIHYLFRGLSELVLQLLLPHRHVDDMCVVQLLVQLINRLVELLDLVGNVIGS